MEFMPVFIPQVYCHVYVCFSVHKNIKVAEQYNDDVGVL